MNILQNLHYVAAACGGAQTSIIDCSSTNNNPLGGIGDLLSMAYGILTAGVGIAALASVVYAGILYTTSAGNSTQTQKAIGMIRNVVIGIVLYALVYFLLNWLVPGGVTVKL